MCFSVMFEHCPYNHLLPRCKHGLCCAERWRIKQHQGAVALLLHLLLFPSAIIGTCHFWMSYSCWVVLCINFCLCFFGPFSFKWYKMWHISLSFSTVHKTPFHYTSSFLNLLCKFLIWVENHWFQVLFSVSSTVNE